MTKKIFSTICTIAISVFMAAIFLTVGILYPYFSNNQQEQMKVQAELVSRGVSQNGYEYFENMDTGDLRITWIDRDGTVLFDTNTDYANMENHLEREEVAQALENGFGQSSRYSKTLTEKMYYNARLLKDGTVIRLAKAQSTVISLFMGILQPVIIAIAVAVVLALVLARHLSKQIVKPLNEIDLENLDRYSGYEEIRPLVTKIENQQIQLLNDKQEIEKAEKIRQEFTANVSHELKTPLHAVQGYAELLKDGLVKSEDIPVFAQKIYKESHRMTNLVNDIIDLSHLDSGAKDMTPEITDLYLIAQNAVDSIMPIAESENITVNLTGESCKMNGIPQLLYGLIYNLCDNAIKYNRPNGSVNINVEPAGKNVILTISDTGIGIPKEHHDRIFERFYRVDKSRSKAVGGTGLGLSIVKHTALIHNATIDLKSDESGTVFTIKFPI